MSKPHAHQIDANEAAADVYEAMRELAGCAWFGAEPPCKTCGRPYAEHEHAECSTGYVCPCRACGDTMDDLERKICNRKVG